eukprot:gene53856-71971_t
MSVTAVDALDKSTDQILGWMEDPDRAGAWDRRGLVVGHVQSGKTANYSGLICKAADSGYKIIVILAGLHNNLRSQTQIRLEEGFLGYETSATGDIVKLIGVGEHGRDFEIKPNCATNRTNNGDFNTKIAKHLAITPEQRPWLFVVKKHKVVLERLLKWIRGHVADATDERQTGVQDRGEARVRLVADRAEAERQQDAAERGDAGKRPARPGRELPFEQLALDLEADQQEEHRHQRIVDPVQDAQAGDIAAQRREIERRHRRVRDDQRQRRGDHEQHAAGGL